jgi:LysM repeat protein
MVRIARSLALLLCCAAAVPLLAQDSSDKAAGPAVDRIAILQQLIEQQSRQLDVLAQEIARLNLLLEGKTPTASGLAPSPADAAAPAAQTDDTTTAPRALPADAGSASGPVHIVTKGETLTAIARRYRVTVPDLLKLNKISDVRKLQIGQSLALPPGAKLQESPTPTPQP